MSELEECISLRPGDWPGEWRATADPPFRLHQRHVRRLDVSGAAEGDDVKRGERSQAVRDYGQLHLARSTSAPTWRFGPRASVADDPSCTGGRTEQGHPASAGLDITVLIDEPPSPFRASTVVEGWPVERFVRSRSWRPDWARPGVIETDLAPVAGFCRRRRSAVQVRRG
jgi:hypothetical protein